MTEKNKTVYDFVIVGAGIAGLSSAYHLAKDGNSVLIVDQYDGLKNASFNSNAIMSHDPDALWQKVISKFGIEGARDLWDVGEKGMELLGGFAENVRPHFTAERMPAHIFSLSPERTEALARLFEVYRQIGVEATFTKEGGTIHKSFHSCITIPKEGQTNNQAILKTLASSVKKLGGKIVKDHGIENISTKNGYVEISAKNGKVFCGKQAVLATGTQMFLPHLPVKTDIKRTFVIEFENHKMPDFFKQSVYWDNEEPYHYIRTFRKFILWVGGADIYEKDYDPGKDYYKALEEFSREKLLLDESFTRGKEWSGTFYPTETGLPYIGKIQNQPIYVNLGFGGTGITLSFVSGYLIASWLKGRERHYERLFAL